MGAYVKKTARRRYDKRQFTVRAVHRDPPELHKLCEALIRLILQEVGQSRHTAAPRRFPRPTGAQYSRSQHERMAEPRRRDRGRRSTGACDVQGSRGVGEAR